MTASLAFLITLLHSLWQSGLLWLGYNFFSRANYQPDTNKSLLIQLLYFQVVLSIATFIVVSINFTDNPFFTATSAGYNFIDQFLRLPLLTLYSLVVLYKFMHLIQQWKQLQKLRTRPSIKAPAVLRSFAEYNAIRLGIQKKVIVRLSETVSGPFTFGYFKPIILLPVALVNQLSMEETESIVLHELAHISNNDYLNNLVIQAIDVLYFFNPFMKLFIECYKIEREKKCDETVLNFKYSPCTYGEALLKTGRYSIANNTSIPLYAVNQKNELAHRIACFQLHSSHNKKRTKINFSGCLLLLFLTCLSLIICSVQHHEKKIELKIKKLAYSNLNKSFAGKITDEQKVKANMAPASAKKNKYVHHKSTLPSGELLGDIELINPSSDFAKPVISKNKAYTKQIIIQEENTETGKSTTIVLQSIYQNGEWKVIPILTIEDEVKNNEFDSLQQPIIQSKPLDYR